MKIDLHTHILPENWPDLKEVMICIYSGVARLLGHRVKYLVSAKNRQFPQVEPT